jgi:hypothetical protein
VIPLLQEAASLGGPVDSLRESTEWWASSTVQQVKDRVALMSLKEAESLLGELNSASSLAEQAVRLSKSADRDVARASVIQAKRRAVARVVYSLLQKNHVPVPKDDKKFIKKLGRIMRDRFGQEVADSIFAEAKKESDV